MSLSWKRPTRWNVQTVEPSLFAIVDSRGMRSPTFQPYFVAISSVASAAVREVWKAARYAGGISKVNAEVQSLSGVIATMRTHWVGLWYVPPNRSTGIATRTPGTVLI